MAELIPTLTYSEFKLLKPEQLKRLKSCEVTYNCEYLFTFVRPQTDYVKLQVENFAQLGNSVGGEKLEDILNKEVAKT